MKLLYFSATLQDSPSPVWRRFVVPMDYTFSELHQVMQIIFGYKDKQDYEFIFQNPKLRITVDPELYQQYRYFQTDEGRHYLAHMVEEGHEVDTSVEVAWAEDLPIDPLTLKHTQFSYLYDFGDEWYYDLVLMDIVEEGEAVPCVREGLGTAPYEEVGGREGYYELVEVLTNPDHADHEAVRLWVNEMDYHFYDQDDVNEALKKWAMNK